MRGFLEDVDGVISGGDVDAKVLGVLQHAVIVEEDGDADVLTGTANGEHLKDGTVVIGSCDRKWSGENRVHEFTLHYSTS